MHDWCLILDDLFGHEIASFAVLCLFCGGWIGHERSRIEGRGTVFVGREEQLRDLSVRTALVYEGTLDPRVETEGYFDFIIPFARFLQGV